MVNHPDALGRPREGQARARGGDADAAAPTSRRLAGDADVLAPTDALPIPEALQEV